MKVLILVTHLLGVGHLTRSAAVARGLAEAGHRVTLVSGGRPAPLVDLTDVELVQLPPVHCVGTDFSTLLRDDGQPIDDEMRQARIDRVLEAFQAAAPDLVITETYPFGRRQLAPEFRALIEAAAARRPRPAILASVRDILNPPSRPQKAVEAEAALGRFYDGVLVHGDGEAVPLGASWPVSPAVARRLIYTGYVGNARAATAATASVASDAAEAATAVPPREKVLVSGGNSAAALPLFAAAVEAGVLDAGRHWRILIGHGVAQDDFDRLARDTAPNVTVERARRDFAALLAAATVSVSQAGYNTALDLLQSGTPAVLVPFEDGGEAEQRLRAEALAERGLAALLPQAELTPRRLLSAVDAAAKRPRLSPSGFSLDGVAGSVRAIETALLAADATEAAWRALTAKLDGLHAAGRTVTLWWRDDDAERPTPALDRLTALAAKYRVPLALAVSPALATTELATWTRAHPDVTVLVHGHAHHNHAPAGAKKQELGFRNPARVLEELTGGLWTMQTLFGEAVLPVLVPPWNRIDASLVPHLAAIGYRGLSTFKPRAAARVHDLTIVNTHCDPIDWKRGGGLRPEAGILRDLIDALDSDEPLGLLTHHLVHDEWVWRFLDALLDLLAAHPAVRFAPAADLFTPAAG